MSRRCVKGFPCSSTCISRSKLCWANLSTANSRISETFSQFVNRIVGIGNETVSAIVNLDPLEVKTSKKKTTEELASEYGIDERTKVKKNGYGSIMYDFSTDNLDSNLAKTTVELEPNHPNNDTIYTVDFLVNDSFKEDKTLNRKEKMLAAISIQRNFERALAENLKDGDYLTIEAFSGDNAEQKRLRRYEKLGFLADEGTNILYGVVKEGKVAPLTREDFLIRDTEELLSDIDVFAENTEVSTDVFLNILFEED